MSSGSGKQTVSVPLTEHTQEPLEERSPSHFPQPQNASPSNSSEKDLETSPEAMDHSKTERPDLTRSQSQASEFSQARKSIVVLSLCMALFLAALDVTIITTALPTIAQHFEATAAGYTWIGSGYLLASAASSPVWGKVSDIFGRKPILLLANAIFMAGSLIAALAVSVEMLVAARVIQGIGGGGLITLVYICISDLFSMRERPKYFGIIGMVWATASGVGPVIGGAFTEKVTWRWCFYINLPLDGLCFIFLFFFLKLSNPKTPLGDGLKAIDWIGVVTIAGGVVMFLIGMNSGGITHPWDSAFTLCLIVFGIITIVLFFLNEWKLAKYPVIPLRLFRDISNLAALGICFIHSFVFIGGSFYLPLYFQVVLTATPILSGVYLFAMVVTFSIVSAGTGIFIKKTGLFREPIWFGLVLMTLGTGLFIDLPSHPVWSKIIIYQIIAGIGIGPNFQSPLIALQSHLKGHDIAAGTATFGFVRNVSTAMSIALGGVVFQNELKKRQPQLAAALGSQLARQFASSSFSSTAEQLRQLAPEEKDILDNVYTESLKRMWIFYTAFSAFGLFIAIFITKKVLSDEKMDVKTGLAEQERVRVLEKQEDTDRRAAKHSRGNSKREKDIEQLGDGGSPHSPVKQFLGMKADKTHGDAREWKRLSRIQKAGRMPHKFPDEMVTRRATESVKALRISTFSAGGSRGDAHHVLLDVILEHPVAPLLPLTFSPGKMESNHSLAKATSPDLDNPFEDGLFGTSRVPHETVETVPWRREDMHDEDDTGQDTLATLPQNPTTQHTHAARLTQPTQIIRRSPPAFFSSSPSRPTIQVAASSPVPTPASTRKSGGVLASTLMAPAGTFVRRPLAPPQPRPHIVTIDSDDEGPTYKGDSSDDERQNSRSSDIKTTTFQRRQADSDNVPESPAKGNNLFRSIITSASYGAAPPPVKRPGDPLAAAYGNSSKRPKQTGPSRALPVASAPSPEADIEIDDISDTNERKKVHRMTSILTTATNRHCFEALRAMKGNYDDAVSYVLEKVEQQSKPVNKHVSLTGSDDELMPTPAGQRKYPLLAPKTQAAVAAKQQARVPQRSITDKWGSTQQGRNTSTKKLDVFDTPPKKPRTLVRGRKDRSSPRPDSEQTKAHIGRPVVVSDDSDEEDTTPRSTPEASNFDERLLKFFNECTVADLVDTAVIKTEHAEHIVSKRPFNSMNAVNKIEAPDLKPTKQKRKPPHMGEKVADKVGEMLESYEAVDYLVRQCENITKPLATEIKSWGVKLNSSANGELDMISLHDSQRSAHDSGIGTPVSDDEVKYGSPRNFLKQPSIMSSDYQMKDYQVVGMNWLTLLYKKRLSCILADDMGLGKTLQVIAFLAHLLETGDKGPHLVVVPAATLENWLQEFRRFCPALNVEPYYSTQPGQRAEIRAMLEDTRDNVNVVVTTYQLAKAKEDFPWLRDFGFRCAIFDEGHVLKNAESQVSRKLNRIKSKFRLLLTGTPLQNNLRELISLLAFMMPDLFQAKQDDLKAIFTHNVKALDENHEALLSSQRIARARSMLTPFILRRKKYQVLKDLPKKDRRVEYCDLTPEQAEIYGSWLRKALDIRERRERGEDTSKESTQILMKLRQAAIHPFLFRRLYQDKQLPKIAKQCLKAEQWRQSNPDLIVTELLAYSDMEMHALCEGNKVLQRFALNDGEWLASGKVQKMLALLRTYIAEGHRTLVFSQFTMVLDILELVFEREAIAYFRLDGSTKVSERQDLIDEFSSEENKTPVFMLSTKAGGAGINLAKANKVIVFDSGFNPQDDIQAENRAHRIGQVKDVEVVRLVSKGTVEEQIYKMGLTKLRLDEEVAGVGEADLDAEGSEKGKTNAEGDESDNDKELEGQNMVEEMFFKRLEENPEEVVAEAKSPVTKKNQLLPNGNEERDAEDDSQKTLKPYEDKRTPSSNGDQKRDGEPKVKDEPSSQPKARSIKQDDDDFTFPNRRTRALAATGKGGSTRKSPRKDRN